MNFISKFLYFFSEAAKYAASKSLAAGVIIENLQRQVHPEELPFLIKSKPNLNYSFFEVEGKHPIWISEIKPGLYKLAKKCV